MKLSDRLILVFNRVLRRKDALFFDGELPGFGLRVTAQGTRMSSFNIGPGPTCVGCVSASGAGKGRGSRPPQARKSRRCTLAQSRAAPTRGEREGEAGRRRRRRG